MACHPGHRPLDRSDLTPRLGPRAIIRMTSATPQIRQPADASPAGNHAAGIRPDTITATAGMDGDLSPYCKPPQPHPSRPARNIGTRTVSSSAEIAAGSIPAKNTPSRSTWLTVTRSTSGLPLEKA